MTDNGGYQINDDDRQWKMTDNGGYQINDDDRQWKMTDQGNGRQQRITYNQNDKRKYQGQIVFLDKMGQI